MSNLDSVEKMGSYVSQVSGHRKWILNPDQEFTRGIVEGLATNAKTQGFPLCPCRDPSVDPDKNKDIICPCRYAQADIDQWGQCYCGLFLGPGKDPAQVSSIPERRPETP